MHSMRGPDRRRPYQSMWPANARGPILGFAAYSGTGKTTLLRAIIPRLVEAGVRLALVKHAHHTFDVDKPGKDSYVLRKAGAGQVLVTSPRRRALIMEKPEPADPELNDELLYLDQSAVDLILVEGFKHERFPKIELRRAERENADLAAMDDSIIAVASDTPPPASPRLPWLDMNQPGRITDFILDTVLQWDPGHE